jgi:hypothetical protein
MQPRALGTHPALQAFEKPWRTTVSLSTQLLRGALALPLLLLFALLGLTANGASSALSARAEPAATPQLVCRIELARPRTLMLAQAPADLEGPARWRQNCRT